MDNIEMNAMMGMGWTRLGIRTSKLSLKQATLP